MSDPSHKPPPETRPYDVRPAEPRAGDSRSDIRPSDPAYGFVREVDSSSKILLDVIESHKRVEEEHHRDHEERISDLEKWHIESVAAVQYEADARRKRGEQWKASVTVIQVLPGLGAILIAIWAVLRWAAGHPPPPPFHP